MKWISLMLVATVLFIACNNAGETDAVKDSAGAQPAPVMPSDTGSRIGDTASYERMPQHSDSLHH